MKVKSVRKVETRPSRCISVDSDDRLFSVGGESGAEFVTHNSVAQRNIIFGCIMRPDRWRFLGIDLKRVELSQFRAYSNVVLGIATELEDALTVLRFAQQTMMKRYDEMEQLNINNFLDLPDAGQALMVMVDEATELLAMSGVKALAGSTPIPTPNGFVPLEEIEEGDSVLGVDTLPTTVSQKYAPESQDRYDMTIRKDSTGETETIVSGAEHYWVAYFEYADGEVEGPEVVDTKHLELFKNAQDALPAEERTKVKFRRARNEDLDSAHAKNQSS